MVDTSTLEHITLFTTALCNLNCNYCYICKDAKNCLLEIDKQIDEDFKNNAYINQIKDLGENIPNQITGITLWGGEPFLKIDRFIDNMESYIEAFPNFYDLDWSTNFTLPNQVEKINQILRKLESNYRGKQWRVRCQISIDGYAEMNDLGRGKGVTDKFLKNFRDLCEIDFDENKILMDVFTKPTLSRTTFPYMDTPDKCRKWFYFFEENMFKVYKEKKPKFHYSNSLWNCAQPTEWTDQDGKKYAEVIQSVYEVQSEIKQNCAGWKGFASLIPEACNLIRTLEDMTFCSLSDIKKKMDCAKCGGGCGVFSHQIIPIPGNRFTMCHRGLFDAYVDYANNLESQENMNNLAKNFFKNINVSNWVYNKEDFLRLHEMMMQLYNHPNKIWYSDAYKMVKLYARAGIIDEKYLEDEYLIPSLGCFLNLSSCIQDNFLMNGSWVTHTYLEIPLFYNGVMDIALKEFNDEIKKRGLLV